MQNVHRSVATKSRRFCSVPQCSSYSTKDISLHCFPRDPKVCKLWKHALKIGKPISKFMLVCSKHFLDTDFYPVTPSTTRKRLRNVVPTQHLPTRQLDGPKTKIDRRERNWFKTNVSNNSNLKRVKEDNNSIEEMNATLSDTNFVQGNTSLMENPSTSGSTFEDKMVQTCSSGFELTQILNSDEKLRHFTGVDTSILQAYERCVENVAIENNWPLENLNVHLILVLCKLKTNMTFSCLAVLFNMSLSTCTKIFYTTITLLSTAIKPAIYWPTKEEILKNMPKCFNHFKDTRVILDCTEVKVQKLKCLKCRIMSYSHYKGTHTIKFLIGITPSGLISYVSPGYGGRATDKAIFNREKVIEKLNPHDAIMVDKGVLIQKECDEYLIKLIRPPFLKKQKQLTKEDAAITANIARARVHVERAIQRIKTFKILRDQIDWYLIPYIDNIVTVVAATVNMSPPILSDDKF